MRKACFLVTVLVSVLTLAAFCAMAQTPPHPWPPKGAKVWIGPRDMGEFYGFEAAKQCQEKLNNEKASYSKQNPHASIKGAFETIRTGMIFGRNRFTCKIYLWW
jgi:hypothetical protein